jgi:transglutaminase-like putative cysteine protease
MSARRRRPSGRAIAAGTILLLWIGGLGLLARRELFRPQVERLAEAALRITPGVTFYAVLQGTRQIGFASSSIDTAATEIRVTEYLVADLPVGGRTQRASARTRISLSRALRVRDFDVEIDAESGPIRAAGRVDGDTLVTLTMRSGSAPADTQRFRVAGPVLLPTLVPLAVALGDPPTLGRRYEFPVFDPIAMAPQQAVVRIAAESLFVVHDSATMDTASGRWREALPDTVRAWRIDPGTNRTIVDGWVDAQGRLVQATQLGTLTLVRRPYEVAVENWRLERRARGAERVTDDRDILETTAIAARRPLRSDLDTLRVRLRNVELAGYDLTSPRQQLVGDTLTVWREGAELLSPTYAVGPSAARRWPRETAPEPLLESDNPEIAALARRIVGTGSEGRHPRHVAERLNQWVHDSLKKRVTFGIPSALQVLRMRSGDCNEHTQLYVALARSLGLPARIAAGLVYLDGKFYYHAWPEVYLADWVAVDPLLGQFPADAAHIRFVTGGLARQAELLRLIGELKIDVLDQ